MSLLVASYVDAANMDETNFNEQLDAETEHLQVSKRQKTETPTRAPSDADNEAWQQAPNMPDTVLASICTHLGAGGSCKDLVVLQQTSKHFALTVQGALGHLTLRAISQVGGCLTQPSSTSVARNFRLSFPTLKDSVGDIAVRVLITTYLQVREISPCHDSLIRAV